MQSKANSQRTHKNRTAEPGQLSSTALGYGTDDRGFESRKGLGNFLFTTASRQANGSGADPASYPTGTRGFFTRGKAKGL
jgi:hypothetical protein